MTTNGTRRRYPISDSANESDTDDNGEILNSNAQLTNKRRVSATGDFASHRFIVSERQQLAVLKQLTATDEINNISSSTINSQLQYSRKVFRRNEHGETIVHIAARKGNLKQLKKALNEGANVNEEDNAGWTPLHEAVTKNQFKATKLLLKSGANSNALGPEGQTPLIDAVLNNNTKIVELLLNYSADPSIVDLTRLNETMIKVLKREITILDLSDNENDNESLSSSSLIISADESEQDDKNHLESKISQNKSCEHTSDSSLNNDPPQSSTIDNELSKKNLYDFESDDEKTKDFPIDEHSLSDNEQIYRIPPLRIILARAVSQNSENNMDDNSSMESTSLPIIEENEEFLSTIVTLTDLNNKVMTQEKEQEKKFLPVKTNSSDEQIILSKIIDNILTKIESNLFEEENLLKKEKQNETKQTTRTLRSHAKGKLNFDIINHNLNKKRRVSNRRRILEKKFSINIKEKSRRIKKISTNETSNHSDDQIIENLQTSNNDRIQSNEDTNIGDDDSNSTLNIKRIHIQPDINSLPPNKRRLRERNITLLNSTDTTEENLSIEATTTSTTRTRDIPINSIRRFLEIRQQINKRHQSMLNDFVLPKIPKDFAETLMAKKNYLIASSYKSFSITTPASLGIKRLNPPSDLDLHLSDVFTRQEDERYKMKLRHQVEREKLILSYEQEVLRLYGNATRSSINQDIPFSYCSLLKDNEVYNDPSIQERSSSSLMNNDYTNTELGRRGKNRWNGRSFIKWLDDSNHKYRRLSYEINQRQHLEANTLYLMQRMVWLKHLPKETSSFNRINSLSSERYLPKVEININFWTHWETNSI